MYWLRLLSKEKMMNFLRPVTDSYEDYLGVKRLYDDWKQTNETFTYPEFVEYIRRLPDLNSVLLVAADDEIITGSCKVILEPKLVFGTYVCHIEDVVVNKAFRHQGIGTKMMQDIVNACANNEWSDDIRVYKVRLGCKNDLAKFYEKSGFERTGSDMVQYIKQN